MHITEQFFSCQFGELDVFALNSWVRVKGAVPLRVAISNIRNGSVYLGVSHLYNASSFIDSDWLLTLPFCPIRQGHSFDVALVIPTGLGAEVGGRSGDAGPTAMLMASVCDRLVTHPNVVNASDINYMPDNTLYVEGNTLTRYICGEVGIWPTRKNRVLVVIDGRADKRYITMAINAVNAARSSYGFLCVDVLVLSSFPVMRSMWSDDGRATGKVVDLDTLFDVLKDRESTYDAVALTSRVDVTDKARDTYYTEGGVNPWGAVEAMLTHAVSRCFSVPCAHAPMLESEEVEALDYGVVDPRDAAEQVSVTYIQSVLRGLSKAPVLCQSSQDVACVVIPRRCFGVVHIAAAARGIPVIAVDDKLEVPGVDCAEHISVLRAANYIEAAGMVAAMRAGVSVESLQRPLEQVCTGYIN